MTKTKLSSLAVAVATLTLFTSCNLPGTPTPTTRMTTTAVPAPAEETKGAKIDDESITAQVNTTLAAHSSTSALTIKIETRNGKVTLTGIAKNAAGKYLVTRLVSDIHGVKDVNNEMTIKETATE